MLISQLNIVILVYKYRLFGRMLLEIAFMVLFADENTHTHILLTTQTKLFKELSGSYKKRVKQKANTVAHVLLCVAFT